MCTHCMCRHVHECTIVCAHVCPHNCLCTCVCVHNCCVHTWLHAHVHVPGLPDLKGNFSKVFFKHLHNLRYTLIWLYFVTVTIISTACSYISYQKMPEPKVRSIINIFLFLYQNAFTIKLYFQFAFNSC